MKKNNKQKKVKIITNTDNYLSDLKIVENETEVLLRKNEKEFDKLTIKEREIFDFKAKLIGTELLLSNPISNVIGSGFVCTLNTNKRILVTGIDSTFNLMFDTYGTDKMRNGWFYIIKLAPDKFGVKYLENLTNNLTLK